MQPASTPEPARCCAAFSAGRGCGGAVQRRQPLSRSGGRRAALALSKETLRLNLMEDAQDHKPHCDSPSTSALSPSSTAHLNNCTWHLYSCRSANCSEHGTHSREVHATVALWVSGLAMLTVLVCDDSTERLHLSRLCHFVIHDMLQSTRTKTRTNAIEVHIVDPRNKITCLCLS